MTDEAPQQQPEPTAEQQAVPIVDPQQQLPPTLQAGSQPQAPPLMLEPQPAANDRSTAVGLIERIERIRGSRVLVYWTSPLAKMADGSVPSLYDQLSAIGDVDHLDLILHTGGGDTEIPWRMVSLIREFATRFSVVVPHRAASAGTLLAMGADEIVMTRYAVLGPIDPSRTHPLLPRREGEAGEPVSVQDMRHAMQFIREAGRVDEEFIYTPEAMAEIFTALFDKLHPLAIGAIEQSYALSKLIGTRCLETHMTGPEAKADIAKIVDQLCDEYKSHAYQIPRREAKAIGLKVECASSELEDALMTLYRHYFARPMTPPTIPQVGVPFTTHIAWLDSTASQLRCEAQQQIDPNGQPQPMGDRWTTY
jgi:Serine dehydrogenase proteinase